MKIGILTVQRAINYGAVLQCYALQQTLSSFGHDVWVINYLQNKVETVDRSPLGFKGWLNMVRGGHPRGALLYPRIQRRMQQVRARWDSFLETYIHLTDQPCTWRDIPQDFDLYVVGSDQVLNSRVCMGLDPAFWGDFKHRSDSRIVTYAASTSVKNLQQDNDKHEIGRLLKNFSHLAFREKSVTDYVNATYNPSPVAVTVLDPTLVAGPDIWQAFDSGQYENRDYVLYFGARPYDADPQVLQHKAEHLAQRLGCETMSIAFGEDTPCQFVEKFKHARAVVTSSYHGVMFSLIFRRPLLAVKYGDEQDARYTDLLSSLEASDMLGDATKINDMAGDNYEHLLPILEDQRQNSFNYLNSIGE